VIIGTQSWVAVVAILVGLAIRFFAMQRRRTMGQPGTRGFNSTAGFQHRSDPSAGNEPSDGAATVVGGTAPGWFRDPFIRHEQRYWSGSGWTEHIQDHGVPGIDPPPPPRGSDP
jgi:Protein of unknown function (DUF2510)